MNETFNIQCIILKRDDFRETDSRVLVYSLEKGLLELIARGTKKAKSKLAAHLEPMSLVEIMVIRGKNYDYVGSALAQNCFRFLKDDYIKIISVGKILKRVSEVIRAHEIDENIFYLLVDLLVSLNFLQVTIDEDNLLEEFFVIKMMTLLGYQPIVENCLVCGKLEPLEKIFFNVKKGGLECSHCLGQLPEDVRYNILLSIDSVVFLQKILVSDFAGIHNAQITEETKSELRALISAFEKYHLS